MQNRLVRCRGTTRYFVTCALGIGATENPKLSLLYVLILCIHRVPKLWTWFHRCLVSLTCTIIIRKPFSMGLKRNYQSFHTIPWKWTMWAPFVTRHTSNRKSNSSQTLVSIFGVMDSTAAIILILKSGRSTGSGGSYTRCFTPPPRMKSHGVRSGDRGGHVIRTGTSYPSLGKNII